ncbi:HNH endonuclease [Robbsia andropogonis]|uniref:HNH endonuclease n=1 Tax=Robbsia andropogonis TaxID=28092 RepID=UPI003D20CB55
MVWLLCTGDWPPLIDHLNGIRSDNAFSNLRIADKNSNAKNRALFGNGKKLIGAYKTSNGTFVSAIISDGIRYYLGVFQDEQAAHQAYVNVRRELMAAEIAARKCVLSRFVKGPVRIDKAFNMAGLVMLQSDQAEKH